MKSLFVLLLMAIAIMLYFLKLSLNITIEDLIQIALLLVSIIALIKGLYEYSKAQKWKKAEFVSKEMKEFLNDFDVKRAFTLLDWSYSDIPLKENDIVGKKALKFDNELIYNSLKTHLEVENGEFTDAEATLKIVFDALFEKLLIFEHYIKTNLITNKDIKPYLIYWIEIIADIDNKMKPIEIKRQMFVYIDQYGYSELRCFFKRFGFDTEKIQKICSPKQSTTE